MILDLYAGCGGWSEGLALLGLSDLGIEWMPEACATRAAAGHATIRADLTDYRIPDRVTGYIASPPCQTFSAAGKGDGAALIPAIVAAIHDGSHDLDADERTAHVLRVARDLATTEATWIALEQVPPVLPVWEAIAHRLRARGYSVWCGVLNAADFGVPQTRRRAILMASRVRVASPPAPTHAESPAEGLFGPALSPWVTMADALGWGETLRPCTALVTATGGIDGGSNSRRARNARAEVGEFMAAPQWPTVAFGHDAARWVWEIDKRTNSRGPGGTVVPTATVPADRPSPTLTQPEKWVWRKPATTIAGDPRITARNHHDEGSQGADAKTTEQVQAGDYEGTEPIRLTIDEALVLQSFRPGYPLQGSKTAQFLQVGNAVPPLLAAHIVASLTGRPTP